MNQPPAFQFYADDFISGVADMSQSEVGAYIMLLAHSWNTHGLKSGDPARLEILAKGKVSEHVLGKFKLKNGRLFNDRQEKERKKQREYRAKQAINGAKGGRPSLKAKPNPSLSFGLTQTEPKKSSPSPSPSPSPSYSALSPESAIPTWEEVKDYASGHAVSEKSAESFFKHHRDNSMWLNKHGVMIDWRNKIVSWAVNDRSRKELPAQSTILPPARSLPDNRGRNL
jgi:uncharacterized protein YdaU (DUF1376 family)